MALSFPLISQSIQQFGEKKLK